MPLLGKIVVIKRNGVDGTEFPLTASCLFGRKLDCDIRIQLPQVSKEHCRIDLNENKELILTNLSSVNPTRINGQILQQSERLKDGDLITIIDRSFRFEYPPPPTPKKKRLSTSEKGESVKVLQDQQVRSTPGPTEKKKSEHSSDTCLKDGSNLPPPVEQIVEPAKGDEDQPVKPSTDSSMSPFSELYHMVKRDLVSKSPWKSKKISDPSGDKPKENDEPATPKSSKKRRSSSARAVEVSDVVDGSNTVQSENPPAEVQMDTPTVPAQADTQKRRSAGPVVPTSPKTTPQATPQKFTAGEAVQQILEGPSAEKTTPKSPRSRRSVSSLPQSPALTPKIQKTPQTPSDPKSPAVSQSQTPAAEAVESEAKQTPRTSPRANAGKRFQLQDVLQEVVNTPAAQRTGSKPTSSKKHKADDLPVPVPKRKRVSFGGQLSPELFDKRLPPNSPLRRGATPGRRSLGFSQKPQSLLRRASTISLMAFQCEEAVQESPVKSSASTKKVSSPAKTPSPARKSPSAKPKTPSPKNRKSPANTPAPSASPATPKAPKSAKRLSNASSGTLSDMSLVQTPTVTGRFSVSRICTPSPVSEQTKDSEGDTVPVVEMTEECRTPKIPLRRSSMKVSARKTPKSALRSTMEIVRSRRSGASRANLKVVSSWADIVKFGQTKPQAEGGVKKVATKQKPAKQSKVAKPKTPVRKLKDTTSTGHADSPATIVIGRAYTRAVQPAGAAPKIVPNVALFRKDMRMDEDLTGVAEIFKTPAASKQKSVLDTSRDGPQTLHAVPAASDMSVMNTPEGSGEMMVSPMSVASTAKYGRFNSEAVTRLLQANQDVSFVDGPQLDDSENAPEVTSALEMPDDDQKEETEPQTVQTPQQKPAQSECLTGVKRLLRTPKQKAEPVEDLRGRLLRTPKEPRPPQEDNLEGVKELLKTPKQNEDLTGLSRMTKTSKVKNSPVVCAAAMKRLMKTPKDKVNEVEDLTGVKQLMKTPKVKGEPVEEKFGLKRLMKTPKQKNAPVEEDLTGIKQMMKTPKQKNAPVEEDLTGIQEMMKTPKQNTPVTVEQTQQTKKTPKQKNVPLEEDLTGIKHMMKTPKQKNTPVEEDLTGIKQMMKTPKQKNTPEEVDLTGIQEMMKTPKQNTPVTVEQTQQTKKTPKQKNVPLEEDLTGIQEMMKTPKQKGEPVEDLVGVKRLFRTPKQKGEPIENQFGIKNLMKTPRQRGGETVEDFTGLAELVKTPMSKTSDKCKMTQSDLSEPVQVQETLTPVDSDVLAVEDVESEDKENICPVEDVKNETDEPAARDDVPQAERLEEPESVPETRSSPEEVTAEETHSHEEDGAVQEEQMETECQAVDASPCLPSPKQEMKSVVTSPAKATQRSGRGKTAQKSQKSQDETESAEVESVPAVSAPLRGRRAKLESVPVPSPARKTTRGRVQKHPFEDQEMNEVNPQPAAVKPKQGMTGDEPVLQADAIADVMAEVECSLKSPPPATKGKRGRRAKHESEEIPVIEPTVSEPEAEAAAPPESEVQSSSAVEASVKTNTRGRRGRPAKKESPKTTEKKSESTSDHMVSDLKSSEAVVPEPVVEETATISQSAEVHREPKAPVKTNTRGRRGRPTKKESPKKTIEEEISESVSTDVESDIKSLEMKVPEPIVEEAIVTSKSAEVQESEAPLKTITRGRRGRPTKKESTKTGEEEMSESTSAVVESSDTVELEVPEPVTSESAEVQEEAEAPVKTNMRTKRGKASKKDTLKAAQMEEPTDTISPAEESEIKSADEPQTPVVKSGRGRKTKAVTTKDQPLVEEPKADAELPAEVVGVKSGQGTKSRQLKAPVVEDAVVQPTESGEPVKETEEPVEAPVKPGRGGRRLKQSNAKASEAAGEDKPEVDLVNAEETEVPASRSGRGKRTAAVKEEPEGPVKRGRRAAAAPAEATPVVKSSRGRKAVRTEPVEVPEDAPAEKMPEMDETPALQVSSEGSDEAGNEVTVKRGRGRIPKKTKAVSKVKDELTALEDAGADCENTKNSSKKAVNWNSDLVACKNIEAFPGEEEEAKKQTGPEAKVTAADSVTESKPVKGRKGKASKKPEEPAKSESSTEESAPPVRRGRTGTSVSPKNDGAAATPKGGTKRKKVEGAAEETQDVDSLPKRRRGKAAGTEAQPEVAVVSKGRRAAAKEPEEIPSAEEEQSEPVSKKEEKAGRGRRKAAQDADHVPAPTQEPVPEAPHRGARAPKKAAELDVPLAPVRRTRRK